MSRLRAKLRRWLPTREQLHANRWLKWIGPHLHHPRLWHWSRRGVALGVALGVFFGLLIPVAQIPASAVAAVVLRANLPAAAASTLITNPITFGPIYYAAYQVGAWLTGDTTTPPHDFEDVDGPVAEGFLERVAALGKPLLVGLALMATLCGLLTYLLVSVGWRLWVLRRRSRRRRS